MIDYFAARARDWLAFMFNARKLFKTIRISTALIRRECMVCDTPTTRNLYTGTGLANLVICAIIVCNTTRTFMFMANFVGRAVRIATAFKVNPRMI